LREREMKAATLATLLALAHTAAALSLTTAPRVPAVALRRGTIFLSEETKASTENPAASAEPNTEKPLEFTPPPAEPQREFDLSQYSITLSIFAIFVIVKTLSFLGIMDSD